MQADRSVHPIFRKIALHADDQTPEAKTGLAIRARVARGRGQWSGRWGCLGF